MAFQVKTFVLREVSQFDSDRIPADLRELEREGHRITDVRREEGIWRIYAVDRRFHDRPTGVLAFRRRATDF